MKFLKTFCKILIGVLCTIAVQAQPIVNLGADTSSCDNLLLDAGNIGASYLWNTGETTQTILLNTSGVYWVDVQDGTGTTRDSIDVTINTVASVTRPLVNGAYCGGIQVLEVGVVGGTVLWYDSTGAKIAESDTLNYNLTQSTTLYYQPTNLIPTNVGTVGEPSDFTVSGNGSYRAGQSGRGIQFDALQAFYLKSTWISVDAATTATVELRDNSGVVLYSTPLNLASGGDYQIELGYEIPIGVDYELVIQNIVGGRIFVRFPYSSWANLTYSFLDMKTGVNGANVYTFFFDWETYLIPNGVCVGALDSVQLTLLQTPVVDLGADTSICGSSYTLNIPYVGTNLTYQWNTTDITSSITANSSGWYSVTVTEGGQCSAIDSINLEINPVASATRPLLSGTYCEGTQVLEVGVVGGTVVWYDSVGVEIATTDTLNYNLTQSTTLYYQPTNLIPTTVGTVGAPRDFTVSGNGSYRAGQSGRGIQFDALQAFYLKSTWISVDAATTALVELRDNSGTVLYSTPLNLASGGDYQIELGYEIPIGVDYELVIQNIVGGRVFVRFPYNDWANLTYPFLDMKTGVNGANVYTFFFDWETYLIPNGLCVGALDSFQLTLLPTPVADLGADTSICGNSYTLSIPYAGSNTTYQWNTIDTTSSITISSSGQYSVTVTEGGQCIVVDSIDLELNPVASATRPLLNNAYCGGIQTLEVGVVGGTVVWYDSAGVEITTADTLNYDLTQSTTLYYQPTNLLPTTVGTVGAPRDFTVSGNGFYAAGQSGRGIQFDALQAFYLKSTWISVDAATTALVELRDNSGTVLHSTPLNLASGGNYKIELGYEILVGVDYELVIQNIVGGDIFVRFPYNDWSNLTYPFLDMKTGVNGSNVYTFFFDWETYLIPNGVCVGALDSVQLTLLQTPVVDLGVDTAVCGSSYALNVPYIGNNTTYQWSTNSTNAAIIVNTSQIYSVTVTEDGQCTAIDSIDLAINPTAFFNRPLIDTSYCRGEQLLEAGVAGGTIVWLDSLRNELKTGDTLNYDLTQSATLYYQPTNLIPTNVGTVGAPRDFTVFGNGRYAAGQSGRGIQFDVLQAFYLKSTWISVDAATTALVELRDNSGSVLYSTPLNLASGGDYQIELGYEIPIGLDYELVIQNIVGGDIFVRFPYNDWSTLTYPFLDMKVGVNGSNVYTFFFDWETYFVPNGLCVGALDSVRLTLLPTPVVDLGVDTTICTGGYLLDVPYVGNNTTYQWSSGAATSSLFAGASDIYSVTVTEDGLCSVSDTIDLEIYAAPTITQTPVDSSYCGGNLLFALGSNTGTVFWYDSTNVLIGNMDPFVYDFRQSGTIYYEASNLVPTTPRVIGEPANFAVNPNAFYAAGQSGRGIQFNALQDVYLKNVQISVEAAFSATIQLRDNQGNILYSTPIAYGVGGDYQVTLDYEVEQGVGYELVMIGVTGKIFVDFPYNDWNNHNYSFLNMTGGVSASNVYGFFYDWEVYLNPNGSCTTPRDSIVLTLLPTPVIDLGVDTTICGDSLRLDASYAGNNMTYLWDNLTTNAQLNISTSNTYQVTVTENNLCSVVDAIVVDFYDEPNLLMRANDTVLCKGAVSITADGGSDVIFWYDQAGGFLGSGDTLPYQLETPTQLYYQATNQTIVTSTVGRTDDFILTFDSRYYQGQGNEGIVFDVLQPFRLHSVKINVSSITTQFTANVILLDASGAILYTTPIVYNQNGSYEVILDYEIPVGNDYTLILSNPFGGFLYSTDNVDWNDYTYSFLDMKEGTGRFSDMYRMFYDWELILNPGAECFSPLDSVLLDTLLTPTVNLVADSIYCADTVLLDATFSNSSYNWNTAVTTPTIEVTQSGDYIVTATIGGCSRVDTAQVYLVPTPIIQLISTDTITCVGTIARIATGTADQFEWYTEPFGGQLIGTDSAIDYYAQNTDTIWVTGKSYSDKTYTAGLENTGVGNLSDFYFPNQTKGLVFDVHQTIRLKDVAVYLNQTPLIGTVQLWDSNDIPIDSAIISAVNIGKNRITLNFDIVAGQDYKLVLTNYNTTPLLTEQAYIHFPIVGDDISIKSGLPVARDYEYFYDWNYQKLSCSAERIPNVVTVLPTPIINFPMDTIICGDSVILDVSSITASSYQWSTGANGSNITVGASQLIRLNTILGSCSDEDSINVILVDPPSLIIPPSDTIICEGELTLYATGNAPYYAWYDSSNATNPIALGDSILLSFEDTTTLWLEGLGFLPSSEPVGLTRGNLSNLEQWINPASTLYPVRGLEFLVNRPVRLDEVSIYTDAPVTADLTILKNGFPIYTQSLTLNTVGKNDVVINTLLESGSYTMQLSNVTGGNLLIITPVSNFGQFNTPEISFMGSTPLTGQYIYFYEWKVSTPSCGTSRLPFTVFVPEAPEITMNADTATCTATSLVIKATDLPNNNYTYLWNDGSTGDSIIAATSGYYEVTATNNGQCQTIKNIYVQLLTNPVAQLINDTSICSPQDITLSGNTNNGIVVWYEEATLTNVIDIDLPYTSFIADTVTRWLDVAPLAATRLGAQSSINALNTSSYFPFNIPNTFDVNQYTVLDSVAIYTHTAPTTVEVQLMDASGTVIATRIQLITKAKEKVFIPIGVKLAPATGYQLSFNNMQTSILVDQSPIAVPSSSANVAVLTGTASPGVNYTTFFDWHFSYAYPTCHSASDSVLITVNLPIQLPDSVYVCDTAVLSVEHPEAQSYSWNTGETTSSIVARDIGWYVVTVSDGLGCILYDSTYVDMPKSIFEDTLNTVCDFILSTNYTSNEATFLWGNGAPTASISIPSIGTYIVTVTTNAGCILKDSVTINQIVAPPLPNLPANITTCFQQVLDAGFGGQNMSYIWNTGDTTQTITVTDNGYYAVTVTHPLGCTGIDYSVVDIDTIPQAGFTFNIFNGKDIRFNNTTTNINSGTTFRWEMGDPAQTISTLPGPFHSYPTVDCYDVLLIVSDPCGVDTFAYENILNLPDSICGDTTVGVFALPSELQNSPFSIVPNPNEGNFFIQLEAKLVEETRLQIMTIEGKVIYQQILAVGTDDRYNVDTENLPAGVYLVELQNSKQRQTNKMVIIKK